jgi:hypothetical protein
MLEPPSPALTSLTIVTVTYQDLERFRGTAQSIASSFALSIEWVVVIPLNDSPTRAYLQSISDFPRLRIVDDLGSGIYEAMNVGLYSACGDYVCFLNSGDLVASCDLLQQLINFLSTNQYEVVIAGVEISWRNPQLVSLGNFQNFIDFEVDSFISHQSVIIQRQSLFELGGFNTNYRVAADTDLIIRAGRKWSPGFFEGKVFDVEQPNFASQRNRRARVEVIVIAVMTSSGFDKVIMPSRLIFRELHAIFARFMSRMNR